MEILLEILKLGSVGLIAGFFSSYLANRDYRQRKWWELRVAAYQSTIESLSDLVYYYDVHFSAAIEYRELPKDVQDKLSTYWESAFPKVRKSADSGAFLFSPGANAVLRDFIDQDDPNDSWPEHLDNRLTAAKQCLKKLVECSKEDLKLKPSFLERIM